MNKPSVCSECGLRPDFRGLQKHHIIFRSQGGKETQWLCGKCHSLKHGIVERDSKPRWSKKELEA